MKITSNGLRYMRLWLFGLLQLAALCHSQLSPLFNGEWQLFRRATAKPNIGNGLLTIQLPKDEYSTKLFATFLNHLMWPLYSVNNSKVGKEYSQRLRDTFDTNEQAFRVSFEQIDEWTFAVNTRTRQSMGTSTQFRDLRDVFTIDPHRKRILMERTAVSRGSVDGLVYTFDDENMPRATTPSVSKFTLIPALRVDTAPGPMPPPLRTATSSSSSVLSSAITASGEFTPSNSQRHHRGSTHDGGHQRRSSTASMAAAAAAVSRTPRRPSERAHRTSNRTSSRRSTSNRGRRNA